MTKHPDTTEWDRMRREQRSAHHDAAMTGRHVIADVIYALERIECTCGVVVKADEDRLAHDRHAPLVAAWEAHKREARAAREAAA
jgi:hypothetical protein